jgi:hypothetical protein
MKVLAGMMLLACVPLAMGKGVEYPKEKVASYVIEKVSVKVLPSEMRPKLEKGKQTFADYGFVTAKASEKEAVVEAPDGGLRINFSVLEVSRSGIYVCMNSTVPNRSTTRVQRVMLLKSKNADGLLKGSESAKEFDSCPAIGGADLDASTSTY